MYGDAHRCPHCGTIADVEAADAVRYRCKVCGGPRVVVDLPGFERSGKEKRPLDAARRWEMKRTAWRMGGWVVGGFGIIAALTALATLSVISPGLLLTLLTALMVALPFAFAAYALRSARKAGQERDHALDEAWQGVAREVVATRDEPPEAHELAEWMRVDETTAELLLAALSVDAFVRARVEDAPPRARIASDEAAVDDAAVSDELADEARTAEDGDASLSAKATPR